MIDLAKRRALLAAAQLDVRGPLRPVLQDGQDPEGGYTWNVADASDRFVCGDTSRREAEAIAAMVDPALLDELEALRTERDKAIGDRDEAEAVLSTMLEQAAEVDRHLEALVEGKPTSVCSFCHALSENVPEKVQAHMLACEKHPLRAATQELEVLRPLPRILDSYRRRAEKDHDQLTAWRTATGCASPEQAEQLARDAVVVREGHWDALLAEREQWKVATGCDTPEEVTSVAETLDAVARCGGAL